MGDQNKNTIKLVIFQQLIESEIYRFIMFGFETHSKSKKNRTSNYLDLKP